MSKSKLDHLNELASIAFEIDDRCAEMDERTKQLKRLAALSRAGQKDTQEFKDLEWEAKQPTAFDLGDEIEDLRKIVNRLRKYKFDEK